MEPKSRSWQEAITDCCNKYDVEVYPIGDQLQFICPLGIPSKKIQKEIVSYLPSEDVRYVFVAQPRVTTLFAIKLALDGSGASTVEAKWKEKHITFKVKAAEGALTDGDSSVWPFIADLMKKDGFVQQWTITVNDTVMSTGNLIVAQILNRQSWPVRSVPISQDDLLNLKISLATCETVDQFLEAI